MTDNIYDKYKALGIDKKVYDLCESEWEKLSSRFKKIDDISEYNQLKVLSAFQKNRVSDTHLTGSTGYGYTDIGRDLLESVYADIFNTEDALVRAQITCGTHALTVALFGNLRPGDELLYVTGKPYDTLEDIIGIDKVCSDRAYRDLSGTGTGKRTGIRYAGARAGTFLSDRSSDGGQCASGIVTASTARGRRAAVTYRME